jgi:hypothetical protein
MRQIVVASAVVAMAVCTLLVTGLTASNGPVWP